MSTWGVNRQNNGRIKDREPWDEEPEKETEKEHQVK